MKSVNYETKTALSKLRDSEVEQLCAELERDKQELDLDNFFQVRNHIYDFATEIKGYSFRIDCGVANDKNHPNYNGGKVRLYYLQVQDTRRPSCTYANVVYPQLPGYTAAELADVIMTSLKEHQGYYLYV